MQLELFYRLFVMTRLLLSPLLVAIAFTHG